jgi:hypothetical protein
VSSETDASLDADVILTATIVGFSRVLREESKPVQFDSEGLHDRMSAKEQREAREKDEELQEIVGRINGVLTAVDGIGGVTAGTSPGYDIRSKLIFGVGDGDAVPFEERSEGRQLSELAAELHNAVVNTEVGYRGRGAYTGFVDPPAGSRSNPMVTSTFRIVVPDDDKFGERWHPSENVGKVAIGSGPDQKTWGMILTNAVQEGLAESGMGFVPPDEDPVPGRDIIGYTHGMTQAVVACEHRGELGSRPFEIAVGNETTKLASCFPCTMFMYSCLYPPSSIHLDSGESWVPFYEYAPDVDVVIDETSALWYDFCRRCLISGVEALNQAAIEHVEKTHMGSLDALNTFLYERIFDKGDEADRTVAANLILDALTVHSKERDRVKRTLRPS